MLNIPQDIKNLYKQDTIDSETYKQIKISFSSDSSDLYPDIILYPGYLYPSEKNINNNSLVSESVKLTESLCSSENIEFGNCEASQFEFECTNVTDDLKGKEIRVTQILNGYELPYGYFTIDSVEKTNDKTHKKVIAYDKMHYLINVDVSTWYNALTFPMTLKAFRDSLCVCLGVIQEDCTLVNDSMEITKTIEPKEISALDVLKAICEINGVFGHFSRYGKLKYVYIPKPGAYPSTIYPSDSRYPDSDAYGSEIITTTYQRNVNFEEYEVKAIERLQIRQEENDIGVVVGSSDTSANGYVIEDNFLVYGKSHNYLVVIANYIFNIIKGVKYRPFNAKLKGMPYMELGDLIQINTKENIIKSIVMNRVLSGINSLVDDMKATGEENRTETFGINKSIIQLKGKTNVLVRTCEELSSTITDVESGLSSQITQTASSLTAEITDVNNNLNSKIELTSSSLTTEINDVNNNLSSQITQQADEISTLVIQTGNLEDGLQSAESSITQNANNIALKVDAIDYDGEHIASLINIGTGGIQIEADRIDLAGYATFHSLETPGETIVYGGNVETDNLLVKKIYSGYAQNTEDYGFLGIVGGSIGGTIGLELTNSSNDSVFKINEAGQNVSLDFFGFGSRFMEYDNSTDTVHFYSDVTGVVAKFG